MKRSSIRTIAACGVIAILGFLAADVDARGRGGGGRGGGGGRMGGFSGGGFSRTGPASAGSLKHRGGGSIDRGTRASPQRGNVDRGSRGRVRQERPEGGRDPEGERGDRVQDREDQRQDRQDFRQDTISDRQDFRQNAYDEHSEYWRDHHEYYEDRWRFAVGASLTASAFRSLSCASNTVVVGGVTYYQCGSTWYQRSYTGGNVTYIVVTAPAGH